MFKKKSEMKNTESFNAYLKSPYLSTKHSTYFRVYDELFRRYKDKKFTFVEIGILGGGSLFMWREFFGPNARIIGIDLNPNAKKWEKAKALTKYILYAGQKDVMIGKNIFKITKL